MRLDHKEYPVMLDLQALRVLTVPPDRKARPGLTVRKVRRVILGQPVPRDLKATPARSMPSVTSTSPRGRAIR